MKKIFAICSILLCLVFSGCGQSDAAKKVDNMILPLKTVTLNSENQIKNVEKAVNELSAEDKEQLKNLDILEEAKTKLSKLKAEDVVKKIEKIGKVTEEKSDEIEETEKEYNKLSETEKGYVTNYDVLEKAKNEIKNIKKEEATALLGNFYVEEDKVEQCQFYMPKAMPYSNGWIANVRSFFLPYVGKDKNGTWLRVLCNYTGDDWVFFKKVTFLIDGEKYTKTFNYFDIAHDNSGGQVWEYIDFDPSDYDIENLKKIANSTETIARFQGDDYSVDVTITANDKAAIKDAITVYEGLK